MRKVFTIDIFELGVSQLYLSKEKLDNIEKWFDVEKIQTYEPLPVYDFGNGKYTLTDGHTRAYIMLKRGLKNVTVQLDLDEMVTCALGQKLYKTDIKWCEKYNVYDVSDFEKRILTAKQYSVLWLERCKRLHNLIISNCNYEELCKRFPHLLLYGANSDLSEFYFEDGKGKFYSYKRGTLQEDFCFMDAGSEGYGDSIYK